MFVYQNKNREICVTFKDNKPVENPEYVIVVDKDAETITINGTPTNVPANDESKVVVDNTTDVSPDKTQDSTKAEETVSDSDTE